MWFHREFGVPFAIIATNSILRQPHIYPYYLYSGNRDQPTLFLNLNLNPPDTSCQGMERCAQDN